MSVHASHIPVSTQPPRVIRSGAELREWILSERRDNRSVGLVPTMGALHEGHLSLIDASRSECDVTVATIFVNPTQFAPTEDFDKYPRDLDRDLTLLASRGSDLVFAPSVDAMYPPGHTTSIEVGSLAHVLEGEYRPTHFAGVATIVMKLFQLAPADRAYFGRKDYQQTLVIRRMIDDLNVPIELRICPIVREPDGLAMSSRNAYLSPDERARALSLSRALRRADELARGGEMSVANLEREMRRLIEQTGGVDVQYITFVKDGTVAPVRELNEPTTIAIAAYVGKTRLIDNMLVMTERP
jgi:pantoate--beta-alanine ligase